MSPFYLLCFGYLYGVACAAAYTTQCRHAETYKISTWFMIFILGWLISPIMFFGLLFVKALEWITDHW